ncbi:hypothetical protein FMEAI12_4260016 [Parafrankia sp. Ea1.12]|nr:hypothetical protein FMEAI12_4260016 [Parafrankia sp. Ea1.12]
MNHPEFTPPVRNVVGKASSRTLDSFGFWLCSDYVRSLSSARVVRRARAPSATGRHNGAGQRPAPGTCRGQGEGDGS